MESSITKLTLPATGRGIPGPAAVSLPPYVEPHPLLLTLFLGYVGYLYLQVGYRIPLLGAIRFELLLGALIGAFAVIVLSRRKQLMTSPVLGWTLALIAIALIMVPFSVSPAYSWNIFVDRVIKFAMMTVFIVAFASSPRAMAWFIGVFMLVFLRMAYEGMIGLHDGSLIWENQGVLRLHGATPIYMHPNSFGGTQLGILAFCFYFFLATRKWWLRAILLLQAAASMIIVVYTGSRTTYVGLAGFVLYLVLAARSRFKALAIVVLCGIIVAPLVPEQYIERAETIATQEDKEGASIDLRKEIWRDAWTIFTEHPLGVGVGAFPLARDARFGRQQDTHNLYLEVGTNLGVFGLVIFAGFIAALYVTLRRQQVSFEAQLRQARELLQNMEASIPRKPGAVRSPALIQSMSRIEHHIGELKFLYALSHATIGFLVIRLVLGMFGHDFYEIYWWFMSGIALALANINLTTAKRTEALCTAGTEPAGAPATAAKSSVVPLRRGGVSSTRVAGS